jgi:hypothetical protein
MLAADVLSFHLSTYPPSICPSNSLLCAEAAKLADFSYPLTQFYRIEGALTLAVGALLILLPATVLEAPEPSFTAETLMRRVSGVNAGVLLTTVNWVLLDASGRARLGASTFKVLNITTGATVALVWHCAGLLCAVYCFVCAWPFNFPHEKGCSRAAVTSSAGPAAAALWFCVISTSQGTDDHLCW